MLYCESTVISDTQSYCMPVLLDLHSNAKQSSENQWKSRPQKTETLQCAVPVQPRVRWMGLAEAVARVDVLEHAQRAVLGAPQEVPLGDSILVSYRGVLRKEKGDEALKIAMNSRSEASDSDAQLQLSCALLLLGHSPDQPSF
jgi:hypothetical protein